MNEITSLGQTHVHEYYFPMVAGRNFAKYYWTGSAWETEYLHANPLDSTQVVTRPDNSIAEAEVFYPFGGSRWSGGGTQDVRFAGMQERDGETSTWQDPLDPTPNRMYTSGLGRWLTPDPAGKGAASLVDPQTWNMYAYVRNNPTTFTDPSGLILAQPSLVNALRSMLGATLANEAGRVEAFEELREAGAATQAAPGTATAVSQPFNPTITYDKDLSAKDLATAKDKVGGAVALINSKWSELSDAQRKVLGQLAGINVFAGARGGMDFKTMTLNLSFGDNVKGASLARLGSDIAHDSFHITQYFNGQYMTQDNKVRLRNESQAVHFQIPVCQALGCTKQEIRDLRHFEARPEEGWPWLK